MNLMNYKNLLTKNKRKLQNNVVKKMQRISLRKLVRILKS